MVKEGTRRILDSKRGSPPLKDYPPSRITPFSPCSNYYLTLLLLSNPLCRSKSFGLLLANVTRRFLSRHSNYNICNADLHYTQEALNCCKFIPFHFVYLNPLQVLQINEKRIGEKNEQQQILNSLLILNPR